MRLLVGLQVEGDLHLRAVLRLARAVELAVEVLRAVLPDAQDQVDALHHAVALGPGVRVYAQHLGVAGRAAGADAEHEPPLGHVVEHGDAVRDLYRVVEVQQHDAGPECDLLGLPQRTGDEQLRRRHVLPREHHVLADPDFGEAQPVGPPDQLQVLVVGLGRGPPGRVERHHEQTELHLVASWASLA